MICGSLHPEPVRALRAAPRGRFAFGLTPRAIWLLAAGLLLALPGFFRRASGYGMLVWDALVLLLATAGWIRACRPPQQITVERSWSNAPALDSETEIELAVEQNGRTILECRLVDDLPDALVAMPATHSLRAFPRVRAALRYRIEPRERGDARAGAVYLRYASPLGLVERWAMAPLEQTVRVYPALRRARSRKSFSRAAARSTCSCARCASAGWGATSRACASTARATTCATSAGRRRRGAAQLITRHYQTERSQAVWIVLDAGG